MTSMSYELERIENWTKNEINPVKLSQDLPSESQLKEWLEFVVSEKDRICGCFRETAFNSKAGIEAILNYMGAHQLAIISTSNLLMEFANRSGLLEHPSIRAFYTEMASSLEEVLNYIDQYIPDYFDQQLPLTHYCVTVARTEMKSSLLHLQKLSAKPGIEKPLLHLALQPLREFAEQNKKVTYKELAYLKELARHLFELIDADEEVDINWEINMVLFFLDFNDPKFILYATRRLNEQIAPKTSIHDKVDSLHWYISAMENLHSKPGFSFIPTLPPLREQFIAPIKASYQYLLSKCHTNSVLPGQKKYNGNGLKIKTALSVTELAVFIRLFIKKGLIVNGSQIEVIRFMAEHYATAKADEISEESLRSKYYAPDPGAIDTVKGIIIDFVNLLKSADF